jgi:hypothetical protein
MAGLQSVAALIENLQRYLAGVVAGWQSNQRLSVFLAKLLNLPE